MDNATHPADATIAVVIPCYKEKVHILDVISKIGTEASYIIVVDDACPDGTGKHVEENCDDARVSVLFHDKNQGVGGATLTGYGKAIALGATIIVKLDGDGQMDPSQLQALIRPIVAGRADYTKGNRFYNPAGVSEMPRLRLLGNLILSFASKMSSGYWQIFDTTNGFTAIHAKVAEQLPFEKIDSGFFFESDILFRLNIARAVVADVPMNAKYGSEISSLSVTKIMFPFMRKHLSNLTRRIIYSYFLRDFTIASIELVFGIILICFGLIFGTSEWFGNQVTGIPATPGTVIIAALPLLVGSQLLISFINFDVTSQPRVPLHQLL